MLSFENYFEIRNLYARYAFTFDRGEGDAWAELFVPDGKMIMGAQELAGRAELGAFVEERYERFPNMRHYTTNVELEADGDGVRGRAYVLVLRIEGETLQLRTMGEYEDELVHDGERWRFAVRRYDACMPPSLGNAELARALASLS